MKRTYWTIAFVIVLLIVAAVPAFAAGPNFGSAIFADDQTWGTKGNSELPAPNGHNNQSFDGLYKFDANTSVEGQLAVAEAAPTNPDYNGGRWAEYTVTWIGTAELVTSYDQLMDLEDSGIVSISPTGKYFQCPLLPDKS